MSVCFSPGTALFDITPVENLFIETAMREAPGDFVKVYIYGLMLCYHPELSQGSYHDIAVALNLSADQVEAAFGFWQHRGFVNIAQTTPPQVEYKNIQLSYSNAAQPKAAENDEYTMLREQLNTIFEKDRVLNHNELRMVNTWLSELHMDAAAIVLLVKMCCAEKGMKVHFNYINAVIQERSAAGSCSFEDVDTYLKLRDANKSGAAHIL